MADVPDLDSVPWLLDMTNALAKRDFLAEDLGGVDARALPQLIDTLGQRIESLNKPAPTGWADAIKKRYEAMQVDGAEASSSSKAEAGGQDGA